MGALREVPADSRLDGVPLVRGGRQFAFTGGAATYLGTGILALLITVLSLGILYPFALVLLQRWRLKHAFIDGRQMRFTGSAWGLFGNWIKWLLLIIVTLGIYAFWVGPRIQRWKWENTSFALPTRALEVTETAATPSGAPPANWYPNPEGAGLRYWDGGSWTDQVQTA